MKDFVKMQDITKVYKMGEVEIRAADGIGRRTGLISPLIKASSL